MNRNISLLAAVISVSAVVSGVTTASVLTGFSFAELFGVNEEGVSDMEETEPPCGCLGDRGVVTLSQEFFSCLDNAGIGHPNYLLDATARQCTTCYYDSDTNGVIMGLPHDCPVVPAEDPPEPMCQEEMQTINGLCSALPQLRENLAGMIEQVRAMEDICEPPPGPCGPVMIGDVPVMCSGICPEDGDACQKAASGECQCAPFVPSDLFRS